MNRYSLVAMIAFCCVLVIPAHAQSGATLVEKSGSAAQRDYDAFLKAIEDGQCLTAAMMYGRLTVELVASDDTIALLTKSKKAVQDCSDKVLAAASASCTLGKQTVIVGPREVIRGPKITGHEAPRSR